MNRMETARRAQVIQCLVEGNSINSTVRMTGVAKNTVLKLLVEIGSACSAYLDGKMRNLQCQRSSYIERQNLTMRMSMRRFTRLTNAFSKKIDNHCHALALYFVWYNWIRIHKTLRVTPAMAAGLTDKLMDMSDVVALIDAQEALAIDRRRAGVIARQGSN